MGQAVRTERRFSVLAGKYLLFVKESFDTTKLSKDNKYGFALNINHPKIAPLYVKFKDDIGVPQQFPISDDDRERFEIQTFEKLDIEYKKEGENQPRVKEKQPA